MTEQHWFNPDLGPHGKRDGQDDGSYSLDNHSSFFNSGTPARDINAMHQLSDVDSGALSQHHTLGPRKNQASPGNHVHDGVGSPVITSLDNFGKWTQWISNANAGSFWLGSSTGPSIGNGTIVGKYTTINKLCFVKFYLSFGSTTTQGTGYWIVVLPFAAAGGTDWQFTGSVTTYVGTALTGNIIQASNAQRFAFCNYGNGNFWGPGNPATWGAGNGLAAEFFYEMA